MATIKDVATQAGVSIATVSRVINRRGSHTRETEERVYEAIKNLRYTVNVTAKSLKTGLTGTIGIIIKEFYLLNTPEILSTAVNILKMQGFSIEIIPGAHLRDCVTLINEGKFDGLLLVDCDRDEASLKRLVETGRNFVLLGGDTDREDVNLVEIDYFQGGYTATKHLINQGHADILFIEDNSSLYFTQEIKRGYLFAHDENGIQYRKELIAKAHPESYAEKREAIGYSTIKTVLEETDFSAVLTTDDKIAYGVLYAAGEYGPAIQERISVVGFGDLSSSEYHSPSLTTVKIPTSQMGELGSEILVNNIKRKDSIVKRVKLKTQMIHRNTLSKRFT